MNIIRNKINSIQFKNNINNNYFYYYCNNIENDYDNNK